MNLKKTIPYNLNLEEFAQWCEEAKPTYGFEDATFALMEITDSNDRAIQIQVKITRNYDDFLERPRVEFKTST